MRETGEALVASLGITAGMKMLDLGCGDGTAALPAARLGADVLGVDIASNLVDAGNRRAQAGALRAPEPERTGGHNEDSCHVPARHSVPVNVL